MLDWEKRFKPDDFDRIYQKYFSRLKGTNGLKYDPSGWLNTVSMASDKYLFRETISPQNIIPYYSDYHDQLNFFKEDISKLISAWDNYNYSLNEFTLCSSVTLGSLIILSALSKKNVKNVFFESPAYYASVSQSKSLGMNSFIIPTYIANNFIAEWDFEKNEQI